MKLFELYMKEGLISNDLRLENENRDEEMDEHLKYFNDQEEEEDESDATGQSCPYAKDEKSL